MASQLDDDIPISSAPIVMLSPPDTQDCPQDVFHTPPEESLLPSSDVDVPHCTVNQAVDLDDGSQAFVELAGLSDSSEFVEFGKDSELGFSQDAQFKNEIDTDSVTENCSHGFRVLEKGVSDFGESPMKILKLGFDDSAGSCSGVQLEKVEDGMENCDEGKVENACKFGEDVLPQSNGVGGEEVNDDSSREIQMDVNSVLQEDVEMENSIPEENVETEVVQNAGDVPPCTVNQAVDIDDGSQAFVELPGLSDSSEFVDFGKDSDSELGFSQDAQLKNEIDADSITENPSHGFRVLEKGVSDFAESPMKNLKLGFDDSAGSSSGVQSEKVEDGIGNCDEGKVENACKFAEDVLPQSNGVGGEAVNVDSCREIQMDVNSVLEEDVEMQNSIPEENVETEVVQNDGDVNSNNDIGEGSGMREDLYEDANANRSGFQRSAEEKKVYVSVFDLLRVLAENAEKDGNETKGLTLLETAMRSGITFPRPSWLPAGRKSKIFKYDDEVEK